MVFIQANDDGAAHWRLAYRFTEKYGVPDLSPHSLHHLLTRMAVPESPEFQEYADYYLVDTDHPSVRPCNCTCKTAHLCGIQYVDYGDYKVCYTRQQPCKGADCGLGPTPVGSATQLVVSWLLVVVGVAHYIL